MTPRRAAKVDLIQPEVVRALRAVGATVEVSSGVGKGFPDLVVGYQGRTYLMELKDPNAPKRHAGTKLTKDQHTWHAAWGGAPVLIIESVDQALAAIGVNAA